MWQNRARTCASSHVLFPEILHPVAAAESRRTCNYMYAQSKPVKQDHLKQLSDTSNTLRFKTYKVTWTEGQLSSAQQIQNQNFRIDKENRIDATHWLRGVKIKFWWKAKRDQGLVEVVNTLVQVVDISKTVVPVKWKKIRKFSPLYSL